MSRRKLAIVTGASSGIGLEKGQVETLKEFAREPA